jgi:DNA-directed RNA polymerase subunit beta'
MVTDDHGRERERHKVPYGANLSAREGVSVKAGVVLATWDPHTRPIITEYAGRVRFENVEEGATVAKQIDEVTGLSTLVVIDPKRSTTGKGVRPLVRLLDDAGHEIKIAGTDTPISVTFQVGSIITVEDGQHVGVGDVLARIPQESSKTRDITGGLPRVAELFEARRPKDHAIIAEISGTVQFGKDYKNKQRLSIIPSEEGAEPVEYLIPKGKHIHLQDGDVVEKGDYIVDGNPAPHDILAIKGVEELAAYLVNEIQEVYRLQGVNINDKHIEVIVRQMLQKIDIVDPGDTGFLEGEQVDHVELDEANTKAIENGGKPASGTPVLLGITKASLQTRSFFSAASFQETTRVLTEAAVNGKIDPLVGLKENVIVGRLIPAGTGAAMAKFRGIASGRDDLIIEQRAEGVEPAPALPPAE